jgi:hypothetical protein
VSGGRRRRVRRFAPCARALVAALGIAVWPVGSAAGADRAGQISGHVTATSGPVCVLALDANGQSVTDPAASNGSGNYVLGNAPAGQWTVEFFPDEGCNGAVTAEAFQFYAGSSTRAGATPVTVVAGQTTGGIDATMAEAAQITGSVTDTAGGALSGICVILEDTAGRPVLRQLTDPRGLYTLDRLPAGQFIVEFVADGCVGAAERYASQYYPDAASRSGAVTITLHPGDRQDGLDAALAPAPGGGGKPPSPPPAGGGGSSGGGSSSGGVSLSGPAHRRAHIVLLAGPRRGYPVDRHGRLRLRLRCERSGPTCRGSIKLALLARGARRTGRMVGHRAFRLRADGRGHSVLVRVRKHSTRLHLLIHLHNQTGSQVIATVRLRYARA